MEKNYKRYACKHCLSIELRCAEIKVAHKLRRIAYDCLVCGRTDVVDFNHDKSEKKRARRSFAGLRAIKREERQVRH